MIALQLIDPQAGTHRPADLLSPQVYIDDLAVHRGDGIFETVLVTNRGGCVHVANRHRHFARFCRSAQALGLASPDPDVFTAALDAVIAEVLASQPDVAEFSVRYALSRGGHQLADGHSSGPVGWAFAIPIGPDILSQRQTGISVLVLDRGYPAHIGDKAPWLLLGAKTLSYAINQAAARVAADQGCDEALFISHDGVLLEGPTSNLVIKTAAGLLTPDPHAGLLHGTSQQAIFAAADQLGMATRYADLRLADLLNCQAAWLVSSVRTAVPITSVHGADLSGPASLPVAAELTAQFQTACQTA